MSKPLGALTNQLLGSLRQIGIGARYEDASTTSERKYAEQNSQPIAIRVYINY